MSVIVLFKDWAVIFSSTNGVEHLFSTKWDTEHPPCLSKLNFNVSLLTGGKSTLKIKSKLRNQIFPWTAQCVYRSVHTKLDFFTPSTPTTKGNIESDNVKQFLEETTLTNSDRHPWTAVCLSAVI